MLKDQDFWIVIPAYNEAQSIAAVVLSLRALGYERVCVVDDGSADSTHAEALHAGAFVLRHAVNLGQGAALQTGITYALLQGAEYVCTFDADGQHEAEAIERMLVALRGSNADVALGSRFLGATVGMTFSRKLLLQAALAFTRIHARLNITDTHNGLRLFTRKAAAQIQIEHAGMAHASEILHHIGVKKLAYIEVPTTVSYTEYSRSKGQSGFESVKIVLELLYRTLASRP